MDEEETYAWVADAGSAGAAARSFGRGSVRQPRSRVVLVVVWLLASGIMWISLADDLAPLTRILWAMAYGAVISAIALPIGFVIGRMRVRRLFAERLSPGTELTSRFGPTSVQLSGPLSRHDLSYDGLVRVERVNGWVHLQQVGSPVPIVWPGELFPDAEIERMRSAIASRTA